MTVHRITPEIRPNRPVILKTKLNLADSSVVKKR